MGVKTIWGLVALILKPTNRLYVKKMFTELREPVNLDMITRVLMSRFVSSNIMVEIYQQLHGKLSPEEINLIHTHLNLFDSDPYKVLEYIKEILLAKKASSIISGAVAL